MMRRVEVTRIYEQNLNSVNPVVVNIGGARSSKSYSILQLLLQKFVSEEHKEFLIARKTLPSLRLTAYKVFINLLEEYGYHKHCDHNKTNLTVKFKTNTVSFLSVDDPEKIKSSEFNYVFLEEANEFSYEDFMIIKMRLSAPTNNDQPNRIYLSLNPSDEFSWINQRLIHEPDVQVIHSTYRDNPFLAPEYLKILTDLEETDPTLFKIYALGEWAQVQNIIYSNYKIIMEESLKYHDEYYGLDFGYNNPTTLIWIGRHDDGIYVREVLYQTHLTNQNLIDQLLELEISKKHPIYADSAEPARIEEIHRAGYNIHPAEKKVSDGIDTVKRHMLHITEDSVNLIKEIRAYKWREDKNGRTLDEPVKFNDHCVDALRYGLYTHLKQGGKDPHKFKIQGVTRNW